MPEENNASTQTQDEFLKDLEPEQQFNPLEDAAPKEEDSKQEEEDTEELRNRRERRLVAKLQAERESSIALAAKLEVLTAAQKTSTTEAADYLKKVERIYGTDSPEAVAATELLKGALADVKEIAKQEALETFREEQRVVREAEVKEGNQLDDMVEDIEDTYGVTLDGSSKKSFFQLLEKLSPKDSDGDVIAYADPHAVWEELQSRNKVAPSRAKGLASRGIAKSSSAPSTVERDSNERFLRENGII